MQLVNVSDIVPGVQVQTPLSPLFESAVFFVLLFETHIHRNQDRINDCFYFIQSFLFFKFLSLD